MGIKEEVDSLSLNHTLNNRGQSTIEFLFGFIFSISFLLMFASLTLNITHGFMIHFSTFMASRSYLVADNGSNSYRFAEGHARATFRQYKVNKNNTFNVRMNFNHPDTVGYSRRNKLFVGVYTSFGQKLFTSILSKVKNLNMVSESFLGKEPIRHECFKRLKNVISQKVQYDRFEDISSHATLFDNGC